MGGTKHDGGVTVHEVVSGGFICRIGGLQKSPPFEDVVSMQGARCDDALNASLAM